MGGYDTDTSDRIDSVELVDLSGGSGCALANYPTPTNDHTAAFVGGALRSCGGSISGSTDACYVYDNNTNTWGGMGTMAEGRYYLPTVKKIDCN